MRPQRGAGGAGEVSPDDELDGKHGTLLHDGDVGIWRGEPRVRDDVLGLLEPPGGGAVEHGSLERDGREVSVERGLAVGGDGDHDVVVDVGVPDLALVFLAVLEVGGRDAVVQRGGRGRLVGPIGRLGDATVGGGDAGRDARDARGNPGSGGGRAGRRGAARAGRADDRAGGERHRVWGFSRR